MKHHKGRNHHHHKPMKSLPEILTEVQALATVTEDQFEANLATAVADLQALIAASTTAADPVVSVVTTTQSGVQATFVPQA
jgi:hypothetical protein